MLFISWLAQFIPSVICIHHNIRVPVISVHRRPYFFNSLFYQQTHLVIEIVMPWSNSLPVFIIFCKISLRIHFSLQIAFYFPQKQLLFSRILMKCYNRLFIPGFSSSLSRESSEWKALQHCQTLRFPEPWNHQLSSFQKLILIKILFPHQVGDCCWSKFGFFYVI